MMGPVAARMRTMLVSVAVLVGACSGIVDSVTPEPSVTADGGPESATPWIPVQPTGLTCGSLFPAPEYGSFAAVAGITVRAIDRGRFEIRNGTMQPYYFAVYYWETADNLVCGSGVISQNPISGPVEPESSFVVSGGSTLAMPATVLIWDDPCGDGCTRPPIGEYVVPLSDVPAPLPVRT